MAAHLKGRLAKAEQRAEGLYDEITLPSGEVVGCGPRDRFDALCSLLFVDDDEHVREPHWLAALLLEQDTDEIPEDAEDFIRIAFDMIIPAKERRT
jgi:hypothetical protein